MRRVIQDREGNRAGSIGDDAVVGQAWPQVTDDRRDRHDNRPDEERGATIVVRTSLPEARLVAGRRVAIFILEE